MLPQTLFFALMSLLTGSLGLTHTAARATGTDRLLIFLSVVFALLAAQGLGALRKAT